MKGKEKGGRRVGWSRGGGRQQLFGPRRRLLPLVPLAAQINPLLPWRRRTTATVSPPSSSSSSSPSKRNRRRFCPPSLPLFILPPPSFSFFPPSVARLTPPARDLCAFFGSRFRVVLLWLSQYFCEFVSLFNGAAF